MKASKQILSDVSQLRSVIDQRLLYGLAYAEEQQLLNGSGSGQNLHGIIPQATAYAAPITISGATSIDMMRLAMLQAALAEYPATGHVMNPIDWAFIETLKDSEGRYIIGNPQGTASPIIEYGLAIDGPWSPAYSGPPSATGRYEATGLTPQSDYWISVRYVAKNGATSDRYISGPIPAPELSAGISDETLDQIVDDVLGQVDTIASGRDEAEKVAELVLETILNENDALVKEAKERGEGIAIAYQGATQYADGKVAEATLNLATIAMLDDAQAATLFQATSYTNGQIATAMNTVYTKAQTDSGLATTLQQAKVYSDDKETAASLLFATKAERANGDASTLASMTSTLNDYKAEANLTFATISNLGGVSATAALALSSAVDAQTQLGEASFSVVAAAGGDPAVIYAKAKGSTSVAGMIASVLRFANTVGGATVEAMRLVAGEVFFMRPIYIDVGPKRLIVGPGSDWVMWFGPNTITAGAATRINGHWAFGSDGKVYYGSSELTTGGGGFHAQANAAIRVGTRTSPGLVTTSTLRITVSGATGPVTWESAVMGGADDWVVTNASGTVSGSYFETAFRASVSTPGEQKRGQFAFLVTDTGSGKSFTIPAAGAAIYNV